MSTPNSDFFVTFGQKYRYEPHPQFGKAHPDGWIRINAPDEDAARNAAFTLLGTGWATMYDSEPQREIYPRGELAAFLVTMTIVPISPS